jgi:hypothetical protein
MDKSSNKPVAIIAEVVAGWFGFLGVGHLIIGNVALGLLLLIGWWAAIIVFIGVGLGTLGVALICILPVWFVVPIISALTIFAVK